MKIARAFMTGVLVLAMVAVIPATASATIPLGKRIGAGAFHALALREDGVLFAWGANGLGAFGNSGVISSPVPVVGWGGLPTGKSVWGTYYGTSVLDNSGIARTSGDNAFGALGRTTPDVYSMTPAPASLPSPSPPGVVNSVGSGFWTQLVVLTNGQLWAWGNNEHGQFGNGAKDALANPLPVRVGADSDWRFVSAGRYHVAAIKANGTLWTWGYNIDGQIGNGLSGAGASDVLTPYQVGTDTDWAYVLCMADGNIAVKTNGTMYAWGRNNWGQLGLGHITNPWPNPTLVPAPPAGTRWVHVGVGYQHVLATRDDGSLWAWGVGNRGQLGNGTSNLENPTPVPVTGLTGVRQLTGGEDWSMALTVDEWVWTWGHNQVGQLGVPGIPTGTGSIQTTPVQVMNLHVTPPVVPVQVHRFYNPRTREHFYTASTAEKDSVVASLGWAYVYEGVAFGAYGSPDPGSQPVYRMYSPRGTHFYTADTAEKAFAESHGWVSEGIAWYAPVPNGVTQPVHRLYNPGTGMHLWTADTTESTALQGLAPWIYEGIPFLCLGDAT